MAQERDFGDAFDEMLEAIAGEDGLATELGIDLDDEATADERVGRVIEALDAIPDVYRRRGIASTIGLLPAIVAASNRGREIREAPAEAFRERSVSIRVLVAGAPKDVERESMLNLERTQAAISDYFDPLTEALPSSSFKWTIFGPIFIPQPISAAVAHRVDDDGVMVAFVFATTSDGIVDLVGFHVEHVVDAWARAGELVDACVLRSASGDRATVGLTSRRLRTAAAHEGLLAEARKFVREVLGATLFQGSPVRRPVRTDAHDDRYYASMVVRYATLTAEGPGARARLADELGVNETTVRNSLSEAKRRGLYATSGPGKLGQPTHRAYELVKEES